MEDGKGGETGDAVSEAVRHSVRSRAATKLSQTLASLALTTMPLLPQELIDLIVAEVKDIPSLKECSFVESMFRPPSQRILLRSLTLTTQGPETTWQHASSSQNFHIATCITRVKIQLQYLFHLHRRALSQVLATLGTAEELLDFMARPTLRELHTKSIKRIPAAVFLRLVGSAPMLAFHSVTYAEGVKFITLTALRYLVTLRRLSTWIAWTHATTLISSAARTLEDLRFRFGAFLMNALDTALALRPAGPRIRWRVNFVRNDSGEHLTDFAAGVQREMQQAHEARRLAFDHAEQFVFDLADVLLEIFQAGLELVASSTELVIIAGWHGPLSPCWDYSNMCSLRVRSRAPPRYHARRGDFHLSFDPRLLEAEK
ncbi:hypothetical protein DFH09DRAFT_1278069 [Mycena vulgaris]|nr:hypothetical protein DFH09DRAFT_1278069 [Mycena vulgaris]